MSAGDGADTGGDGEGISRFINDQNRVKWSLLLGTIISATILRVWREAIRFVSGLEAGVRISLAGLATYVQTQTRGLLAFLSARLGMQADLGGLADLGVAALPVTVAVALVAIGIIVLGVRLLVDE